MRKDRQNLTFLLQSELPLGLDVLQRCSQVPGQAARAADGHQGALRGQNRTVGSDRGEKTEGEAVTIPAHL